MGIVHTAVEKLNLNLIWPDKRVVIIRRAVRRWTFLVD